MPGQHGRVLQELLIQDQNLGKSIDSRKDRTEVESSKRQHANASTDPTTSERADSALTSADGDP